MSARTRGLPADAGLAALLDLERRVLLEGDFIRLPDIAREKEARLKRYADEPARLRRAPGLLDALRRNQRLIEMALQGLAAAQGRYAAHRALLQRMDTYDPAGRKTQIGHGPVGRIHKKL